MTDQQALTQSTASANNGKNDIVRLVVVGDGEIGKTCMIVCYCTDVFPDQYQPTIFDAHTANINFKDKEVQLHIWDTAGQEDLARVRPLAYPNANCFLVCFSLVDKNSFENAKTYWKNELELQGPPDTPRILVGLKSDLRDEYLQDPEKAALCVSPEEAQQAKIEFSFLSYMECSARTRYKLTEVFFKSV